jgi:hypothetical protein
MEVTMTKGDRSPAVLCEAPEGALAAYSRSQMGPIGPTVEIDIFRLISWYGEAAVAKALREATRAKRGRKTKDDLSELEPIFQQDARRWLEGEDPLSEISNDSIAEEFEKRKPDPMVKTGSIKTRIKKKLECKNYGRDWQLYYNAAEVSRDEHPFGLHLKALRALASYLDHPDAQNWQSKLDWAETLVSDYIAYQGCMPPPELSFADIEKTVAGNYRRRFAVKQTGKK